MSIGSGHDERQRDATPPSAARIAKCSFSKNYDCRFTPFP
jgi:hypothetical protein